MESLSTVSPPGKQQGTAFSFPIISGTLDLERGRSEIVHTGGLSISGGQTRVQLLNFINEIGADQLSINGTVSAAVVINGRFLGRLPIFALDIKAIQLNASGRILSSDINITLTREAAEALNRTFNTTAFIEGVNIGIAAVKARADR